MAENIMDLFKQMVSSGGEANLFNVYKGVPLSFPAKIVSIGDDSLSVMTDSYQTVCMYIEKRTFIQSEWLPEILQAEVIDLDSQERVATLADFRPAESGIGNRMQVRIQPKEALEGNIQNRVDDYIVRGELADFSQDGLAIYLIKGIFSVRQFHKGAQVSVTLDLPGEYTPGKLLKVGPLPEKGADDRYSPDNIHISAVSSWEPRVTGSLQAGTNFQRVTNPKVVIHAEVAYITLESSHSRYRVGMRILPGDPARALITQFIAQRQSEIIREIKLMYDLLAKIAEK